MRLFYHTLMLMLVLMLSLMVVDMQKDVDELRLSVNIMYADPPPQPFKPKRFKPQPLKECPFILSEPVPENPKRPEIL